MSSLFGGLSGLSAVAFLSPWWLLVLGALVLMPLGLGMTQMVLVIGADQWLSLLGHLIYGVVTAVVFVPLSRRL